MVYIKYPKSNQNSQKFFKYFFFNQTMKNIQKKIKLLKIKIVILNIYIFN